MGKILKRYIFPLCALIFASSISSVWAIWTYSNLPASDANTELPPSLNEFVFGGEVPDDEVALIQRILDLLNNDYSNDVIPEGQGIDYLLSTMDKDWTSGFDPSIGSFVGSMDPTAESQARLNAMFGDVLDLDNPDHAFLSLKVKIY